MADNEEAAAGEGGTEGAEQEGAVGAEGAEEQVETPAEKPEARQPATAAEIAAAVAGAIRPQGLSPEQVEAEWVRLETESGMTRQQIIFNDNARREANLRDNLPLFEENGANRAKDVLAGDSDLLVKVKEAMAKHPPHVRANPQAWEDQAFLIKGKFGTATTKKKDEGAAGGAARGTVLGGKEASMKGGLSEGGRSSGAARGGSKKQYSEFEQRIIDTTCGGDAEAYEKFRSKDSTKPRPVTTEGSNRADLALQNLTRGSKV